MMLVIFAITFPLELLGHYTHTFELFDWIAVCPELVWSGQVWRLLTYGFLGASPVDWAVSLFWLATLLTIIGRNWSTLEFWTYCLLAIFAGALPVVLTRPHSEMLFTSNAALLFALLVAWDWFYKNERLLLLGLGEISVRQAAIGISILNSAILFFCCGWFLMLAMWCGGLAGWLYLFVRWKLVMGKTGAEVRSERIARLEL